jgi:hydroxyquinol 1,2-dioxygenase
VNLTDQVLASFDNAVDPRFAVIMRSLVRHLHSFVRDVELTEEEWAVAIDFLTKTGQKCDDNRQEFILLSDVLGASMAVIDVNNPTGGEATESTVLGPFFVAGAPEFANGDNISGGAAGTPCKFSGTVSSTDGTPLAGAIIDVWQSDEFGNYDVQYPELNKPQGRGRLRTDESGKYLFWSVRPESYPIPHDGPVGDLLHAARRSPMRPAHIHFRITAPGHRTLVTHLFVADDPHLTTDAVFGVKDSLIIKFDRDAQSYHASFDFTLAPAQTR